MAGTVKTVQMKSWRNRKGYCGLRIRIGTNGGPCEHGNEPSDFIKFSEILEWAEQLVPSKEGLSSVKFQIMLYSPLGAWNIYISRLCVSFEEPFKGEIVPVSTHNAYDAYEKSWSKTPRILIIRMLFYVSVATEAVKSIK
jgi:hypothetical protein